MSVKQIILAIMTMGAAAYDCNPSGQGGFTNADANALCASIRDVSIEANAQRIASVNGVSAWVTTGACWGGVPGGGTYPRTNHLRDLCYGLVNACPTFNGQYPGKLSTACDESNKYCLQCRHGKLEIFRE
ncbi:hypothetical protein NQ176_g967 [Zarea fungicola]|uniref:Uncharacterized protein n=1 Tax=Zarea fungicola TaxID=93591 RepID=A0ACC1NUS8_9HYPO|nr:hypothetical protein NQ176_g967 [Lecanicillium fungicola]